jgi:hypothetical protein
VFANGTPAAVNPKVAQSIGYAQESLQAQKSNKTAHCRLFCSLEEGSTHRPKIGASGRPTYAPRCAP